MSHKENDSPMKPYKDLDREEKIVVEMIDDNYARVKRVNKNLFFAWVSSSYYGRSIQIIRTGVYPKPSTTDDVYDTDEFWEVPSENPFGTPIIACCHPIGSYSSLDPMYHYGGVDGCIKEVVKVVGICKNKK
jgi:hypothetical protein